MVNSRIDQVPGARAFFVHPDNVAHVRDRLAAAVAVIARPDAFMTGTDPVQLIVETDHGVHTRCYLASHDGIEFLLVYGRVDRKRQLSDGLNYGLTQHVVDFLGITVLVGTFIVGSVRPDAAAGEIFVPSDLVGIGPHHASNAVDGPFGFRTIDMYWPFCARARGPLLAAANDKGRPPVADRSTYATFHGWPRIETAAELRLYAEQGFDVVGQTLDPEATLAKESGTHYAAMAVTVDDGPLRQQLMQGEADARQGIDDLVLTGRTRMFDIFLDALPALDELARKPAECDCREQAERRQARSEHMYYRPRHLCVDW
jgi:purine nucleoside phosphorylase